MARLGAAGLTDDYIMASVGEAFTKVARLDGNNGNGKISTFTELLIVVLLAVITLMGVGLWLSVKYWAQTQETALATIQEQQRDLVILVNAKFEVISESLHAYRERVTRLEEAAKVYDTQHVTTYQLESVRNETVKDHIEKYHGEQRPFSQLPRRE